MMKRRLLSGMAAATALAASLMISTIAQPAAADPLTADSASTASTQRSGGVTPNSGVPAPIQVKEETNKIVATLRGVGKQIYDCNGGTYKFREPAAVLFNLRAAQAGIHGKGPFWTLFDGSKVTIDPLVKAVADTSISGTTSNVPWLLVTVTHEGTGGALSNVTLVQRIDTRGGLAPASCSGSQTLAVDYSANYVFWAPK
jgi:hypothetical protein